MVEVGVSELVEDVVLLVSLLVVVLVCVVCSLFASMHTLPAVVGFCARLTLGLVVEVLVVGLVVVGPSSSVGFPSLPIIMLCRLPC